MRLLCPSQKGRDLDVICYFNIPRIKNFSSVFLLTALQINLLFSPVWPLCAVVIASESICWGGKNEQCIFADLQSNKNQNQTGTKTDKLPFLFFTTVWLSWNCWGWNIEKRFSRSFAYVSIYPLSRLSLVVYWLPHNVYTARILFQHFVFDAASNIRQGEVHNLISPSPWDHTKRFRKKFAIFVKVGGLMHRLEPRDVCDTWGPHSRDGIADKRNNDTETETHLGLPGHRVSKALSQGLLVVSFQIVSQGLLVSQTAPPPAWGGALHGSSLGPVLQL